MMWLSRVLIWIKARPAAIVSAFVFVAGFLYLTRPRKPPAGRSLDREQEDERVREKARLELAGVDGKLRDGIAEAEAKRGAAVEANESERFDSDDPETVARNIEDLLP